MKSKLRSDYSINCPNIMAPNVITTLNIIVKNSNNNLANAKGKGNRTSIGSGGV
jgi:hypothetical protein